MKTLKLTIVRQPRQAPPLPAPERAGLLTKAARLKAALQEWRRAGLPLASRAARKERQACCDACEYYRPTGNLGLGECTAPGCGCTRAKLWLATSVCPLGKWAAIQPQQSE